MLCNDMLTDTSAAESQGENVVSSEHTADNDGQAGPVGGDGEARGRGDSCDRKEERRLEETEGIRGGSESRNSAGNEG